MWTVLCRHACRNNWRELYCLRSLASRGWVLLLLQVQHQQLIILHHTRQGSLQLAQVCKYVLGQSQLLSRCQASVLPLVLAMHEMQQCVGYFLARCRLHSTPDNVGNTHS